jgi:hypothetical protein
MLLIGIDPGTVTGLGVWDATARKLQAVLSMDAQFLAQSWVLEQRTQAESAGQIILVILEDARKAKTGRFGKHFGNTKVLQGVGAVKRESKLWEQWLVHHRIPYASFPPRPSLTKWPADYFRSLTGWTERTNNHARDAACLVFGINPSMASTLYRDWEQSQCKK